MSRPTVEQAKQLGQEHGQDVVIVFSVGPEGQLHYASYGKDRRHCKVAQHLADQGFVAIQQTIQNFEPESTPGFKVVHNDYGAAVYGKVPPEKMAELQQHLEKHRGLNILDDKIAVKLDASFVFTTNKHHKKWREELGIADPKREIEPVYID